MIKREISRFVCVGSLTVVLDFLSYQSLVWMNLIGFDLAKAMGFLIGTIFAYCANRFWTFGFYQHNFKSGWRFMFLYTTTLSANVSVNALILRLLADAASGVSIAFVCATGVSTLLNFLGMKLYVFKPTSTVEVL